MMSLVIAALVFQLAAMEAVVGVGTLQPNGQVCLAMPSPALAPGTKVTLVRPGPQQGTLVATIRRSVPSCERLEKGMVSGPYYVALPDTSTATDPGGLWVVFLGSLATRKTPAGIAVRLGAATPNAQARSCTSQEGVHLTVWADAPLKSERLWHAYFYLGYDVEPSCDERDFGNAKP